MVAAGTLWFLPRPPGEALAIPAMFGSTLGDAENPREAFDAFESCEFRRILSLV